MSLKSKPIFNLVFKFDYNHSYIINKRTDDLFLNIGSVLGFIDIITVLIGMLFYIFVNDYETDIFEHL